MLLRERFQVLWRLPLPKSDLFWPYTRHCFAMTYTSKNVQAAATPLEARSIKSALSMLVVLFKMRIVMLLLFAAWGGAMLGSGGRPSVGAMLLLTVTGILAAGGSGALNQYL